MRLRAGNRSEIEIRPTRGFNNNKKKHTAPFEMFFPSLASSPALPREWPRPGDRHRPGNGETTPRRLPTHAPGSPRNFPSAQRRRGARHAARWETQPGSAVPPGTARRQRRAPGSRRGPAGAPLRTPRAAPRPRAKSASALPSAPRSPGCPHPRAPPAEHPARPARFFFRPTPQSASTPTRHPRVVHAAQSIIPPTPPKKKIKKIPRPTAPTLPALSVPTANRTNRALLAPHPPAAPSRPPGAGRPRRGAGPEHVSRTRETKERGAGSSARQRTAAEDPRRIAEREERGRRRDKLQGKKKKKIRFKKKN